MKQRSLSISAFRRQSLALCKEERENIMKTNGEEDSRHIFRGEMALVIAVMINSLAVILMLYSGSGISAISSVPYAFEKVFPKITLGT